jgi:hypothetical protein
VVVPSLLRLSRFALATAEVATAAAAATEITASDDATEHNEGLQHSTVSAIKHFIHYLLGCLCGLVVGVPGYRTKMYCVSCEVRTEFKYVM